MDTMDDKLGGAFKIIYELLQVNDLDVLLERALTEIRNIIGTDAGSIYLVEGRLLKFSCTQNRTLQKRLPFGKKLTYSRLGVPIGSKSIAGYVAKSGILTNIADAHNIGEGQPYSFDGSFDQQTGYHSQSVLTAPIMTSNGQIMGVIQLINAMDTNDKIKPFTPRDETVVQLFANNAAVAISHAQLMSSVILRMHRMVQWHDPTETVGHMNRLTAYAAEIYEAWARKKGVVSKEEQYNRDVLRMAAMFYNIGKIALPSHVLGRRETLSKEELELRKKHTIYGAQIFNDASSDFEKMAMDIALNHHEHWDGSGFPGYIDIATGMPLAGYARDDGTAFGKRGEEIPIAARIVALADTYDTLLYGFDELNREILPNDTTIRSALDAITSCSGTKFDPEVVEAFASSLETINSIVDDYNKAVTAGM